MYKGNSSRVVPIIIVIIVMAIAIAALVSLGRAVFGGGDNEKTEVVDVSRENLLNTSLSQSVRMTVRGPIVADENFRSYQIVVTPGTRTLTTYSGYLDKAIDSTSLGNNEKAYEQFVYALDKANMVNGKQLEGDADDTRGICATGRVYEFEILSDNNSIKRLWTSTCKGSKGSFSASVAQVQNLFLEQIPNASGMTREIEL